MKSISSKVTSKGQIVIPKQIRDKYGIHASTKIHWIEKDEGILMVPDTEDPIFAARGMLHGTDLLNELLNEKALDKKREEKRLKNAE